MTTSVDRLIDRHGLYQVCIDLSVICKMFATSKIVVEVDGAGMWQCQAASITVR